VQKLTTINSGVDWTVSAFQSYAPGTFKPYDVVTDSSNNVYVSSGNAGPFIRKYDSAGVLDATFTLSGIPASTIAQGLTFANGNLYAVSRGTYKLYEINPTTGAANDFLGAGVFLPDFRSTFLTYTAVPEPSILALVAFGGLALFGRRASRKQA